MLQCKTTYFNSNHDAFLTQVLVLHCTGPIQPGLFGRKPPNISWLNWIVGNGGTRLDRMKVWEKKEASLESHIWTITMQQVESDKL